MDNCIFCQIPKEDKSKLLYKDKTCYVVYDKYPVTEGHMLVISNRHYENILDAPEETVKHVFVVAKKFAQKSLSQFGATGVNVVTNSNKDANQLVMHFHVHVVPRYPGKAEEKAHHKVAGAVGIR